MYNIRVFGLATLVTLGACETEVGIGANEPDVPTVADTPTDLDLDGWTVAEGDCDDLDPNRAPGLDESCDAVDNDCDGVVDGNESIGEGAVCERSDTFVQQLVLDILFVIDADPSMAEHRQALADAVGVMTPYLIGDGRDTHIGAITIDTMLPTQQGRLIEQYNERWINGLVHTPGWADQWLNLALTDHTSFAGTSAGGRKVLHNAFTTHVDAHNAGFLRENAALAIIIVSNRDDPTASPDADTIWSTLSTLKGGSLGRTDIHSIVQDDEFDCFDNPAPDRMGHAYLELSSSLGPTRGHSASVCGQVETLEGLLEAEAQDLSWEGVNNTFLLSEPPVVASLVVTVEDGASTIELEEGVSLATDEQTVMIDPPPPAGTTIRVRYQRVPDTAL